MLSFLEAPMTHTHALADHDEHHAVELAHRHEIVAETHSSDVSWDRIDPASDERPATWFVSAQAKILAYAVVPQTKTFVDSPRLPNSFDLFRYSKAMILLFFAIYLRVLHL